MEARGAAVPATGASVPAKGGLKDGAA